MVTTHMGTPWTDQGYQAPEVIVDESGISYQWRIAALEYSTADGKVNTIHWTVNASNGDETSSAYGSVSASSLNIPFEQLTEQQVVDYLKSDSGLQFTDIQDSLASQIAEKVSPTRAQGLPWTNAQASTTPQNWSLSLKSLLAEEYGYDIDDPSFAAHIFDVAIDDAGGVYIAGDSGYQTEWGPIGNQLDAYLIKINSHGEREWIKEFESQSYSSYKYDALSIGDSGSIVFSTYDASYAINPSGSELFRFAPSANPVNRTENLISYIVEEGGSIYDERYLYLAGSSADEPVEWKQPLERYSRIEGLSLTDDFIVAAGGTHTPGGRGRAKLWFYEHDGDLLQSLSLYDDHSAIGLTGVWDIATDAQGDIYAVGEGGGYGSPIYGFLAKVVQGENGFELEWIDTTTNPYAPYGLDHVSILSDQTVAVTGTSGYGAGYIAEYSPDGELINSFSSPRQGEIFLVSKYSYDEHFSYARKDPTSGDWTIGISDSISNVYSGVEIDSDRAIEFNYTLYEADGTTLASEGLSVASWGSEHDKGRQYVLAFEAESLYGDTITIDDLDITLDFNNSIFEALSANDVQITSDLPLANSALINNADGLIRIAAGSADALGRTTGSGIGNKAEVVRLLVNVKDSAFVGDGLHTNNLVPLDAGIQVSANLDETVFSDLTTLRDQGGINAYATSSSPLNISRANTELTVTGDENTLHLGTQRSIGGASTTNLIRRGDIVANHQVNWRNTGDAAATGLTIDASSNLNSNVAMVVSANGVSSVPDGSIAIGDLTIQRELSGTITDRDQVVVDFSYTATGAAGSVIDLGNAKYTVSANGGYSWESSNASTKNLITYQGDLNYDGRVSMLDLAYLNAGAAQAQVKGTVAHDVDADFNGQIDISDLSILDADWGQSLHTGADSFLGSNMISMQDLLQQGDASWSDTTFRDQNVVEASPDFIPTLDEPGVLAVIDGDGQSPSTPDIQGAALQDALIPA